MTQSKRGKNKRRHNLSSKSENKANDKINAELKSKKVKG